MPYPAVVADLRAGRRRDGAPWVDTATPVLSWRTETRAPGWEQAAAQVRITWPDDDSTDTVELEGPDSIAVAWPFRPLRSRERARIEVTTTGRDGVRAEPETVLVEAPLLEAADWTAQWVTRPEGIADEQPARFRHRFEAAPPVRARLHVTALGVYEAELNGTRVGDEVLAPGWTSYEDRLLHQAHDVTELLHDGGNSLVIWSAGGWFTEKYGHFGHAERWYQEPTAVLAQLELTYADGRREVVATSAEWEVDVDGPLRSSGIYAGEEFDATRTGNWQPARVVELPVARLTPAGLEPVRRVMELPAVEVLTSPSGKTVVDFGQNLVGRVRIRVEGPRGHTVTLRHAEVLEDGELATRLLRYAYSVDRYTLAGTGKEEWEPRFTFHGFRYLQVDDWPGTFDPSSVTAVVCASDLERTGWFECSEPLLERLHENVVWSMRGNFLSIPTDCPQRDERRGWTGDLQVFAGAAATLHECDAFLNSWLTDLALEQRRYGGITPITVPVARLMETEAPLAAWGDATTVVPWTLFERFGDTDLLARQFPSMRTWVDTVLARADDDGLWTSGYQLGDWLDPHAPADKPMRGRTSPTLVASAYLFRSLDLVTRAARVLGDAAAAEHYGALAERTRTAFLDAYVTPRGRMVSEGPTTYALALVFGIGRDPDVRQAMGRRLAEIVREDGYRIGTGFVGTPLILDALCSTGQLYAAGRLLLQTGSPSWLYPVTAGATTIWERWDALKPDGTLHEGDMVSLNHYAFGAVADWLHRGLAGLSPAAPGYRRIRITPTVLDGITSARSTQLTPYGRASVGWQLSDGRLTVTALVPPGTTAEVLLPDGPRDDVDPGEHSWTVPWEPVERPLHRLDLDSDLTALIDDPEALAVVRTVLAEHDPGRAKSFDGVHGVRFEAGAPLRTALMFAAPSTFAAVEDALRDLNAHR